MDLKYTDMVNEKEQQLARKEREHTDILKERMTEKDHQIAKLQKQIGDGIVSLQQKFEKHAQATETNFVTQSDFREDLHFVLRFVKHEFILTDFNKRKEGHKNHRRCWHGERVYSHPGGYCLQLNVDIDGDGDTHSYLYLQEGDYDGHLCWPAEVEVCLKVLNQRGSHAHHIANTKLSFVKSYDSYLRISNPFLSFSELQYDAAKDCEYLKDDCLKFELYIKAIGSK